MKVTRIAHVSVNVEGSLDTARSFYADVFGLEQRERPEIPGVAGCWFGVGPAELHLVDAPAVGSGVDPTGPHFCVFVEDLPAAIAELGARGHELVQSSQGEVIQVWVVDPVGNTVELQQDRGSAGRNS